MAEDRTIPICKIFFATLIGVTLLSSPVFAKRSQGADLLNRYVEARLAESSGHSQMAAAIYAESLKNQPTNSLLAGKAYVKAIEVGDFNLALKAIKTLQLSGNIDAEMPLLTFANAFQQRDWQSAQMAILELKARRNFGFMSPFLLAWMGVETGQDAASLLAEAKAHATGKYYHEEQLILLHLALNETDKALPLIDNIVKRNDVRMAPLRIIVARHFLSHGNIKLALNVLRFNRTGSEARLFRIIESGNGRKRAQKITSATGTAFLFQRLASDLSTQRAHFLALVMAQTAAHLDVKSEYGHYILGCAYSSAQASASAILEFGNVSDSSAYYLPALSSEIAEQVAANHHDLAIRRLTSAIAQNPNLPELRILKGQSLQASGQNMEAAIIFKQAIALGEKTGLSDNLLASYWLALGGAQEQADIWPEGLESLKTANKLQPNSAAILNYLGYAQLERRENQAEAVGSIQAAHKLRSSSPAITDSLGWAYFVTGDPKRAVGYLEQALADQPQDPTINEHLGDVYWTIGRKYEARYAWKSAKLFADGTDIERLSSKVDLGLRPDLISP